MMKTSSFHFNSSDVLGRGSFAKVYLGSFSGMINNNNTNNKNGNSLKIRNEITTPLERITLSRTYSCDTRSVSTTAFVREFSDLSINNDKPMNRSTSAHSKNTQTNFLQTNQKQACAIKVINKNKISKFEQLHLIRQEIEILSKLKNHSNIVKLFHASEEGSKIFLVMEFCNGDSLHALSKVYSRISEKTLMPIVFQLAEAMRYLYRKRIMHRDLKPHNILLHKKTREYGCLSENLVNVSVQDIQNGTAVLKLADFGFAKQFKNNAQSRKDSPRVQNDICHSLCGSPMYMAPEVITNQGYDQKADLWSMGIIFYQLLVSNVPYPANTPAELRHFYASKLEQDHSYSTKICQTSTSNSNPNNLVKFPSEIRQEISLNCKQFITELLIMNPINRISMVEFLHHEYIALCQQKFLINKKRFTEFQAFRTGKNYYGIADVSRVRNHNSLNLSSSSQSSQSSSSDRESFVDKNDSLKSCEPIRYNKPLSSVFRDFRIVRKINLV